MPDVAHINELTELGVRRIVIACGVFDGVHRGHQKLLSELVALAEKHDATPVALTFNPHPRAVLNNQTPPTVLTTPWQRCQRLHEYGAQAVVTVHFSHSVADTEPAEFVRRRILGSKADVAGVCVGSDWRFGRNGEGDMELLRELVEAQGGEVVAVPELQWYRKPISSTRIREAIAQGRLDRARRMLGYPYRVCGHVIHGKGIGSKNLHCPTANLADPMILLPPGGVYAARSYLYDDEHHTQTAFREFDGVVYIGSAPTYNSMRYVRQPASIELHLFDFSEQIYGKRIEVEFRTFLRKEKSFAGETELAEQIQQDIANARAAL